MVPQPHKALVTGMPVASTEGVAVSPLPQRHEGATRFETIRAPGKVVTDQTISASSSTSTPLPAAAPTAVRPSAEPSHRNGTIPAKADPNTTPASPAPAPLSDSAPRIVPQQQIAQLSALIPGALPKKEDVPPPIRSDVIWPDAKPAMRSGPVRPDPSTARPLTPTVGSPPNPAGDAVRPIFGDAVMIDHAPDMSVAPAFSADAPVLSQPAVAARPILQQIMENLPRLPDKPVEISLNPDELGRVRIAVTSQDSGIVVSIHAERPETIDLLRRNIDMLAQEYRDLGYTDIAFDFAQQGGQGQAGSDGTASSDGPFLHADEGDHPQPEPAMLSSDGLDIRI
ncbi:flagellar hook-length control protein FliK [Thalassococcus sp. S3]|uniref:flagellar hook-length control protein FliK n=1 Tax=Thalassococcus sp. S3 TaxID=2017482 RepID=UPI0020C49498|nr:flagellar hook-length control protein FliK [Thalassococcus sp. S3]